jgi:hypothetical protein
MKKSLVFILWFFLAGCNLLPLLSRSSNSSEILPSEIIKPTESTSRDEAVPETPQVLPSPANTDPTMSPLTPTNPIPVYRKAFEIDYTSPDQYLKQGEQTIIADPSVLDPLQGQGEGINHLSLIYDWLHTDFTNYSARGGTIGEVTADQLLSDRKLGGCHDYGLVFTAAVRELGYPAVMIDSYSIAWIEQFQQGEGDIHIGHVFVEVYLVDEWILVDPTNGWYVETGYDPSNPVIPLKGPIAGSSKEIYGFYIGLKGLDTWAYGISSNTELTQAMDSMAPEIDLLSITYPDYHFWHFSQ